MKYPESLERGTTAIPCPSCNGYCDKVDCTKEEIKNQSCGKIYACCVAAFVCRVCKTRIIADLDAPDIECFE